MDSFPIQQSSQEVSGISNQNSASPKLFSNDFLTSKSWIWNQYSTPGAQSSNNFPNFFQYSTIEPNSQSSSTLSPQILNSRSRSQNAYDLDGHINQGKPNCSLSDREAYFWNIQSETMKWNKQFPSTTKTSSRNAAKVRREKENEAFNQLALSLPICSSMSLQLDKASVVRVVNSFIKFKRVLAASIRSGKSLCLIMSEKLWIII